MKRVGSVHLTCATAPQERAWCLLSQSTALFLKSTLSERAAFEKKKPRKNCTAKGTKLLLNKGAYQQPVNNVPKARTCLSKRLCSLDVYFESN